MATEKEKLYEEISKAYEAAIKVIKRSVYPATFILSVILLFGLWWGIDLKNSQNDVNITKMQVEGIELDLRYKSKDLNDQMNSILDSARASFSALKSDFSEFQRKYSIIINDYNDLKVKYEKALKENEMLLSELRGDSRSLSEYSTTIKNTLGSYKSDIEYAEKGIKQRKEDIEAVLKKRNEQLNSVSKSIEYLTEYLVLVQAGRNKFPDPNIQKEIDILNNILATLIPDPNERSKVINRIESSIK